MPEWMKMESIADYCDTSRRNVQNWIYKEGLRHIKVKGTVRIKREWLDQWLEAHEVLKKQEGRRQCHKGDSDDQTDRNRRTEKGVTGNSKQRSATKRKRGSRTRWEYSWKIWRIKKRIGAVFHFLCGEPYRSASPVGRQMFLKSEIDKWIESSPGAKLEKTKKQNGWRYCWQGYSPPVSGHGGGHYQWINYW